LWFALARHLFDVKGDRVLTLVPGYVAFDIHL